MEETGFFEALVLIYKAIHRHILEYRYSTIRVEVQFSPLHLGRIYFPSTEPPSPSRSPSYTP
jgi:hypothetical protein